MSDQPRRRKLSTGATLRPPLHRSSSDSSVLNNADVSSDGSMIDESQNQSSTQDCSTNPEIHEGIQYIPERAAYPYEELKDTSKYKEKVSETDHETDPEKESDDYTDKSDIERDNSPSRERSNISANRSVNKSSLISVTCTCFVIFSLVIILIGFVYPFENSEELVSIDIVKEEFPTQNEELWLSFEAGVQDVIRFKKPVTFILLYQEDAEETLTSLLEKLSKYATCHIRDCNTEITRITDSELNSPEVMRNYGLVIDKYRDKLQERGVMIIKNLHNIPGLSAQTFHAFCDEYTPLVEKSLFIFTMKVDELPGYSKKMKFIEDYFTNKWTDIKTDIRNALITRITSMVLEIHS